MDNYHWLREREDPEVISYLEAENAYTKATMKHTEPLQEKLYQEIKGRIKETDLSVPAKDGDYYYYSRTFEGKQYRTYCRKKGSLEAEEEVLLDINELAEGYDYFRIGPMARSPDHQLLAYGVDTSGSEVYTIRVKDLTTGQLLPDEIRNAYYSLQWANDSRTLFYTTLDDAKRPYKLYRHVLGTDADEDVLVHHEKDNIYSVRLGKTRSKKYLMLYLRAMMTTEVRFLEADDPTGTFKIVHPREHGHEYNVSHHGDVFYIVTNDNAINFKLMRVPVVDPAKANWSEVIPHRPEVRLQYVSIFKDHMVVHEREGGLRRLRIRRLADGVEHYLDFPEPVYTVYGGTNLEFDTNLFRFQYSSLITPRSVFDYDMDARTRELKKQQEVLGGYDPADYESERLSAKAPDGKDVPISLVYRKGMKRDGSHPMLLYGYGSYGASMDVFFSSSRVSLLDRGFIFAIAHVRGGGDLGRPWYEDGKFLKKRNTFTDFIACAEHLIAEKYTSPERLAIMGGSAGGLLMGAVANMRPDLFKAVVAQVPFVDVVTTMLDDSVPLTTMEYQEWGDPNDKTYYDYMKSYSPYDNVEARGYPNILVTAGLNDPRVQYWEPAKWTAKLRAMKTDNNRLLLKTNMGAGHGGKSGRYERLRETAFEYAFILDTLGIRE
jgi:oligopeptidase B